MTYGHWHDRAADALAHATRAAAGTRVAGHGDAAATLTARREVYRQLARLADLVTGEPVTTPMRTSAAAHADDPAWIAAAPPHRQLALAVHTGTDVPTPAPATGAAPGPVARHLATAGEALGLAGDLLVTHLGTHPDHPRTREGHALAMGVGRDAAVTGLAQLTATAIAVDRQLPDWLTPADATTDLELMYRASFERLGWWVDSGYPAAVDQLATRPAGESPLRLLAPAPDTERATGPRPPATLDDVHTILDAARAWMHQQPHQVRTGHMAAAARAAHTVASAAQTHGVDHAGEHARHWGHTARTLHELVHLPPLAHAPHAQELHAAADWLRTHLATTHTGQSANAAAQPRRDLARLVDELPSLARTLQHATGHAAYHGQLHRKTVALDASTRRGGVALATTTWQRVGPSDPTARRLTRHLHAAAQAPSTRPASPDTTPAAHTARQSFAQHRHSTAPDATPPQSSPAASRQRDASHRRGPR